MDLESRMREKSYQGKTQIATNMPDRPYILVSDALQIAREYAEEMCKKQREICANPPEEQEGEDTDTFISINYIKTAPLATDNEDK